MQNIQNKNSPAFPEKEKTGPKTVTRLLSGSYSLVRRSDGLVYRLVLSWILASIFFLLTSSGSFMGRSFYRDLSVWKTLLLMAALMVPLLMIRNLGFLTVLMLGSSTLYCVLSVTRYRDIYFAIGCCIFLAFVVLFSPTQELSSRFGLKGLKAAVVILGLLYTVWIGGVCCLIYLQHGTPNFDFGIFCQMFYYMKKTGLPLTTSERNTLLSHFSVHVSPILYLVLPVYMLIPSPMTLQVFQCLLVASGLVPLVLICRRKKIPTGAAAVFCGIYVSYPAFIGGCFYYFHENNFLTPLILWMILAFEAEVPVWMALTTLMVSLVKEDAAMYAGVVILYFCVRQLGLERSRRKETDSLPSSVNLRHAILRRMLRFAASIKVWLFLYCALYFFVCILYLSEYGQGAMTGRYDNYIYDGTGHITVMLSSILENPIYVLSQCFTGEKLLSSFQIMAPLGFLPLLFCNWEELILLIPYVLMNMMSNYSYQHILGFQYFFGSCAFLFYLSVLHYARMEKRKAEDGSISPFRRGPGRKKLLISGLLCGAVLSSSLWQAKLFFYLPDYCRHAQERRDVSDVLNIIPADAQVAATPFLVPSLSQREEVYDLHYKMRDITDFDYVAIDTRNGSNKDFYREYSENPDYRLLKVIPRTAAVFERVPSLSPDNLFSSSEKEAENP